MNSFDKKKFAKILDKIKNTYSSLNEMARKSGVTSAYLSRLINEQYDEPPSPKMLYKIASVSHGVTSYMELLYICGHIDFQGIFEYYNKTFTTTNIRNAIRKSELFDTADAEEIIDKLEDSNSDYFYNKLVKLPEDLQLKFFAEMEKKNTNAYNSSQKPIVIESVSKIPILEYLSKDILLLKNKRLKLNCDKAKITDYAYFSNDYMKKEYDYIAIIVTDNSMNLKFNKGTILLIQLQESLKQGDIGLISVNKGQYIRRYKNNSDYIVLETLSNNDNCETEIYNTRNDKVEILGKVIAYQGKI